MDAQEAECVALHPAEVEVHLRQVRAHFKGGISDVELYQFFLDSDKAHHLHKECNLHISSCIVLCRFPSKVCTSPGSVRRRLSSRVCGLRCDAQLML